MKTILTLMAAVVLSLCSQTLWACSPPASGLTGSIPPTGSTLPGNSAIYFVGYGISLDDVQATINGSAATLNAAPTLVGNFGVTLSPQPGVGDQVVISGTFCQGGSGCPAHTLQFTGGAADSSTPPTPLMEVDAHDYPDFTPVPGSCNRDSTAMLWVHLEAPVPGAGEAAVAHVVEVAADSSFSSVLFTRPVMADAATLRANIALGTADLVNRNLADLCYRVSSVDLAQHRSGYSTVTCHPCRLRSDPEVDAGSPPSPPDEPSWTSADLVSGGVCLSGGGSSSSGSGSGGTSGSSSGGSSGAADGGEGPIMVPGCGCDATPVGPFPALVLAAPWLAWRLKRRSRAKSW